jgi:hypothetical protein
VGNMGKNELTQNQPRIGWFADDTPTPHVAVMLNDDGRQISLTVPFRRNDPSDPYSRWFSSHVHFADDPERVKHSYNPPSVVIFQDQDGDVVLVGCRAGGSRSNLSIGSGQIVANFAVLGGKNFRYARINGLRTEIPGLARWSGQKSVNIQRILDTEHRLKRLEINLEAAQALPLSQKRNLTLLPNWRTSEPDKIGTFATHDVVQIQASSKRPLSWEDHLNGHLALRDLLVVAGWRKFGYSRIEANREDDPHKSLGGHVFGPKWSEVMTHRLPKQSDLDANPSFIFEFSDIGAKGVRRWMAIRPHFERAIQPFIGIIDQEDAYWETRMAQSGIALEALGYQLEVDSGGKGLNNYGQITYRKALKNILDDMKFIPLADPDDWIERSRTCYMGVKHADNPTPDQLVLANALRENLQILRYWVAGRIGCNKRRLAKSVETDPLSNEYVLL